MKVRIFLVLAEQLPQAKTVSQWPCVCACEEMCWKEMWMDECWCSDAAGGGELPFFYSQVFMNSFLLALRVAAKPQKNNLQLCSGKTGFKLVEKRWSTIINICFSSPRFTITAAKIHPQWKSFQAPAHYRLCGVRDLSLRCDSWPAVQRWSTGEAVTYWFSLKSRNGAPASFLTNF